MTFWARALRYSPKQWHSRIWKFQVFFTILLSGIIVLEVGMSSKSPDSSVSDNVDIFRKKYQKISSFKKVTANLICENIRLKHSENYAIWHSKKKLTLSGDNHMDHKFSNSFLTIFIDASASFRDINL